MSPHMGMAEFFAMEASEYLERLDGLVSPSTPPNPEEFVRLARALRGSALMANQQPIAGAAAGLEAVARGLRESKITWDVANKQIVVRGVDDLKILVRAVSAWTPREDAKARAVAHDLEQLAGVRASTRTTAVSIDPVGTRTFVAREGAVLADALDRAATALERDPSAVGQVQDVLKVVQPLRGLAGLAELPPLPDVLDGIQRAVAEVTRRRGAGATAAGVFRAAARTFARAAREATAGTPAPESPELAEFVGELGKLFEGEKDVVPIDTLYFSDQGPHIVEGGTPQGRGANALAELVSHGDHLRHVAEALEQATSDAQRTLRLQPLADTLAALALAGFGSFAQTVRDVIKTGAAQREPRAVAVRLREAGTVLSGGASRDAGLLAKQLEQVSADFRTIGVAPKTPPAAPASPRPSTVSATPTSARPGASAPSPAARPTAVTGAQATAAATPTPATTSDEGPGLVGSLVRFQRYVEAFGSKPAPLSELLAGPPTLPGLGAFQGAGDAVSIESLCFTGPAALARALSLREQIRAALARGDSGTEVGELLEEVFDLVKLGQRDN